MNDLLGGRYKLVDALGKGGMGIVYAAVQEGLGRRVAVKVLDPRLAEDREQLERFRREAEVVAALGHPNIVQVTDFQYPAKEGDQPFLVMELLRGESLGALLAREQVITAQRAAFIGAQVLSALTAAHRAGVVHRDVKPDNIFLLADAAVPDTVKVLDFGIAKLVGFGAGEGRAQLTGTGAMLGTPAFMAPEQARGATDVDARADVYAVGATLYQALSGRLPHEAPSIPALLFAIVEKSPPPLRELRPDLPSELSSVVERAMAKDRDARFPDADAMRRALAPWSGLPASIPPPTSGTAATIAVSSNVASVRDQATPIVVHHTPASAKADKLEPPANQRASAATRVMIFVAVMFAIAGCVTLGILYLVTRAHARPVAAATTASASPIAVASASPPLVATPPPIPSQVAAPIAVQSAVVRMPAPPPVVKRYSGKTGYVSSTDFSDCAACDWQGYRNDIAFRQGEINRCFAASEHEAPIHENPFYEFSVSDAGVVALKRAVGDGTPNLDRCLARIVTSTHMKTTAPGSFKLGFRSECTPGWNNHCD